MKATLLLLALTASVVGARWLEHQSTDQTIISLEEPQYLLELIGGGTQWATEAEKWELRRDGQMFMDITDFRDLGSYHIASEKKDKYPKELIFQSAVKPLLESLNATNMMNHLEYLTSFHNRYYLSEHGEKSAKWLLNLINNTITETGADKYGVSVKPFKHPWGQHSIIATIPGKSDSLIVVGAHQDSVNHADRVNGRAPGADDDGSGTVTILETFRALLGSQDLVGGKAENTVEFHWYSAEEAGMLGSLAIFAEYEKSGKDVKAMFQQDMTGFTKLTLDAGRKPEFGIMTEYIDEELKEFTQMIIAEYTNISWVNTGCTRCGSDHMAAIKAGYPAIFVIESAFELSDDHIHGVDDLPKYLEYDHMIDHAQMTLGVVYELAFAHL
ncbi:peptide hydrolase-2 [Coleophoma cylindrospora]|uniref:Peptide hydrolase n=1 Tax=Coleophoma cylindrospora TaxID=1849047 RepID=A0A3D8RGM5_9HELO|nr:peptide hydrolase-2 [Coleophoma cylindrospora]